MFHKKTTIKILNIILLVFSFLAVRGVGADFDLEVVNIVVNPEEPVAGQPARISVYAKNSLNGDNLTYDLGFADYYWAFDKFVFTPEETKIEIDNINNILPGDTVVYNFEGKFSQSGDMKLYFSLDVNNRVKESNENNNYIATIVRVLPTTEQNLSVNSIDLDNNEPKIGEPVLLKILIVNSGKTVISGNDGLFISGVNDNNGDIFLSIPDFAVEEILLPSYPTIDMPLLPGDDFYYQIKGNFTNQGTKKIIFQLNRNKKLAESDYSDNELAVDFFVQEKQSTTTDFKESEKPILVYNKEMYQRLRGKILLRVEKAGEAYYLHPQRQEMFFLNRPVDALRIMRSQGQGISDNDLSKIPIGIDNLSGPDQDQDGLTDLSERIFKTKITEPDSDADGFWDRDEIGLGYSPLTGSDIKIADEPEYKGEKLNFLNLSGIDTDHDGLSDLLEDALRTNKNKKDSDKDGFNDREEIAAGFNPLLGNGDRLKYDREFSRKHLGKIFLAVENNGEAWYVFPTNNERYFLGRPTDALAVMRQLGLGISEQDFKKLIGKQP